MLGHKSRPCQRMRPGASRCMVLRVQRGQVERLRPLTIVATLRPHSAAATVAGAATMARGTATGGKAVQSWVSDGCHKGARTMGTALRRWAGGMPPGRFKTGTPLGKRTSSRVAGPAQSQSAPCSACRGRLQPGVMQAYGWTSRNPTGPLLLAVRLVALLPKRLMDGEVNLLHAASALHHRSPSRSRSNLTTATSRPLLQIKTPSPMTHRPHARHCSASSRLAPDRVALLAACGRPRAPGARPRPPPSPSALAPPLPHSHTLTPFRQPMPPPRDTRQHHPPPLLQDPAGAALPAARASLMETLVVASPLLRNRRGSGHSGREGRGCRGALLAAAWHP